MKYITFILVIFVITPNLFAFDVAPRLTDREIIESLAELKTGQEGLNNRIDDMKGLLYVVIAGIFTLIGFVIWDRRTIVAPTAKKYAALEKALIDYSDKQPDLKKSLRHAGLL